MDAFEDNFGVPSSTNRVHTPDAGSELTTVKQMCKTASWNDIFLACGIVRHIANLKFSFAEAIAELALELYPAASTCDREKTSKCPVVYLLLRLELEAAVLLSRAQQGQDVHIFRREFSIDSLHITF